MSTLKELYPSLVKVDVTVQKSIGTVQLELKEKFAEKGIKRSKPDTSMLAYYVLWRALLS